MNPSEHDQFQYVAYRMSEEGFHYCFAYYSDFSEVEDEIFHQLRKQYLEAANELEEYIKSKI
jgi:hypothetical protein